MPDISWEHAAEARAALNAIITDPELGVAALSSPQTMSNLLKDLLPDAPREKSILVAAAEAGLVDTLREHVAQGMDPGTAISLTASSFSTSTPFTPEACTWVAGELAVALGISQGVADARPGAQAGPGQVDPQGMPTQINQIPGFGQAGKAQAGTPQAQAEAYPTQVAPQPFPPGPGQAQGGGYSPGAPAGGYGASPAGSPPGGYSPGTPAGGYGAGPPGGQVGYSPGGQGTGYAAGPGGQATAGGYGPGGQIGGYVPGGPPVAFGPGGPGGRAPRRSGTKRGLLVGGGILVVIIAIIVVAATLSSKKTPSAGTSTNPTQSATPTITQSLSPSPSPTTGVESLSTVMNPSGFPPVGTSCVQAPSAGLNVATLTARLYCTHTTINYVPTDHIVVWGYQFDSHADYLAGFAKINSVTGFKSAGAAHHCPPATSSGFGSTTWDALHNAKYGKSQESGQYLECFVQYTKTHKNQPLLIWTLPSQYVVFISRDEATNGTFPQLMKWWTHVSYG